MQDYFEINVSRNGKHFFATSARSATDRVKARAIYDELSERFPEKEGFSLSVTHIEEIRHPYTF